MMESSSQPSQPLLHRRPRRWLNQLASNLRVKTSISSELSGSVGDLGTYIPIVISLTLVSHIDLSTTLIFTSLYNAVTGALFGVPMPVQPMKSIAAVAISERPGLSVEEIAAAGICTATVLLVLGVTGLMEVLYKFIPLPVVRGVQLSQGLSFAFTAIKYIRFNQDFATSKSGLPRSWTGLDGLIVAGFSLLFLIICTGSGNDPVPNLHPEPQHRRTNRRIQALSSIPSALLVFIFGLILCFLINPSIFHNIHFGPSKFKILTITWQDWKTGFLRAAVPQIPLSILNSVIAVCKLSADLFPDREISATYVSISVGLMNLTGCWFGAMPVCHGAGGLAGQYRFGGRTGLSVVFLAIGKLVLGLVFGNSFVRILSSFPIGILGVLLLFAGIELAMASRDMKSKEESFVMLVCAAVSLTGSSAALGFGCGILLFLVLKLREMDFKNCLWASKRSNGEDEGSLAPEV